MIPNSGFVDTMHPWQRDIFGRYDRREKQFFVMRWHRRSRKTTMILNLFIRECCRYPNLIATMVFPFYSEGRDIVWDDPKMLDHYLPDPTEMPYKKNIKELHVRFANKSLLRIRGADKPDSLRGPDADLVDFSEWAEMKPEAWELIFRPIITVNPRKDFVRCAFFDFTPKGDNHAKKTWDDAGVLDGWYRSELTAEQSGIIPAQQLAKEKLELPKGVYDQEYMVKFITEEERVLITSLMLDQLQGVNILYPHKKRLIAVDTSIGNDETVAYAFENHDIIDELILHERDTMKIVGELLLFSARTGIDTFVIESIGADAGRGVFDRLNEVGKRAFEVNPGEGASDKVHFLNRRGEIWCEVMTMIRDKKVAYPRDPELRRQLTNVHFQVLDSNMKMRIEGKDRIRSNLGRSPDRADTWVIGQWYHQFVEFDTEPGHDYGINDDEDDGTTAMAV